MKMKIVNMLKQHEEYISKYKSKGGQVLTYKTPCCKKLLESPKPSAGEQWDSLTRCPYCDEIFMKISTEKKIIGRIYFSAN